MNNNKQVSNIGNFLDNMNELTFKEKGDIPDTNKTYIVLESECNEVFSNISTVVDFIPLDNVVLMIARKDASEGINFEKHSKHSDTLSSRYSFDYHQVSGDKLEFVEEVCMSDLHVGIKLPLIMYLKDCNIKDAKIELGGR